MSKVKLNFTPSVPVFDANVALGRRHDKAVSVESPHDTKLEMERARIDHALVYSPHAASYDSGEGNQMLLDSVNGSDNLIPQFVCNPAFDDIDQVVIGLKNNNILSVRMFPGLHNYPFTSWVVESWLDWLSEAGIPLWLPITYEQLGSAYPVEPRDIYETVSAWPDLKVVLVEATYHDASWVFPLLKALPNLYLELSRFVLTDGIASIINLIGAERVLFGSRFPESAISPQLYSIHHCGLDSNSLKAVCSGNIKSLLGIN